MFQNIILIKDLQSCRMEILSGRREQDICTYKEF